MRMTFNVIGAGRLGTNMAYALVHHGLATLQHVCNAHLERAKQALKLIGSGEAIASLADLSAASLTFITVPDDKIAFIAARLADEKKLPSGSVVVHCSGALNANLLQPLARQGCRIASLHPLRAFSNTSLGGNAFYQCDCVVEGDAIALDCLIPLFEALGAHLITIESSHKATYHAAAAMASNYLVTLASEAIDLLKKSGIHPAEGKRMISRLMRSNLANIDQVHEIKNALTGPLARGDAATIQLHLQAITNPTTNALYRAAGLATLPLANLNKQQQQQIAQLFLDQKLSE